MLAQQLLDVETYIDGVVLMQLADAQRLGARRIEYDAQLIAGERGYRIADRG